MLRGAKFTLSTYICGYAYSYGCTDSGMCGVVVLFDTGRSFEFGNNYLFSMIVAGFYRTSTFFSTFVLIHAPSQGVMPYLTHHRTKIPRPHIRQSKQEYTTYELLMKQNAK